MTEKPEDPLSASVAYVRQITADHRRVADIRESVTQMVGQIERLEHDRERIAQKIESLRGAIIESEHRAEIIESRYRDILQAIEEVRQRHLDEAPAASGQ